MAGTPAATRRGVTIDLNPVRWEVVTGLDRVPAGEATEIRIRAVQLEKKAKQRTSERDTFH